MTRSLGIGALCGALLVGSGTAPAQVPSSAAPSVARPAAVRVAEEGVRWNKLKPTQREALKPLQQDWSSIDAARKQKWIELADRLHSLPAEERTRVQARMAEWAKLSPAERGQVRAQFQQAKQIPLPDRRSRWEAYQALTPEEKSQLAARAAALGADEARAKGPSRRAEAPPKTAAAQAQVADTTQRKSNLVPNPAFAAPPRPVGPTTVRAGPGATTTLVTRRPAPPPHQHTGLPKIAATPEFVNGATLLPQRGAQGAAIRPVPPSEAAPATRR